MSTIACTQVACLRGTFESIWLLVDARMFVPITCVTASCLQLAWRHIRKSVMLVQNHFNKCWGWMMFSCSASGAESPKGKSPRHPSFAPVPPQAPAIGSLTFLPAEQSLKMQFSTEHWISTGIDQYQGNLPSDALVVGWLPSPLTQGTTIPAQAPHLA